MDWLCSRQDKNNLFSHTQSNLLGSSSQTATLSFIKDTKY